MSPNEIVVRPRRGANGSIRQSPEGTRDGKTDDPGSEPESLLIAGVVAMAPSTSAGLILFRREYLMLIARAEFPHRLHVCGRLEKSDRAIAHGDVAAAIVETAHSVHARCIKVFLPAPSGSGVHDLAVRIWRIRSQEGIAQALSQKTNAP